MEKAANRSYIFEFDEADVSFNNNNNDNDNFNPTPAANHFGAAAKKMVVPASFWSSKKRVERKATSSSQAAEVTCASSLPVNIPKIYKGSYSGYVLDDHDRDQEIDEDHGGVGGGDDQESRTPPHEFLARRRGASFSVHEGIGRTLKGRDLRQVRNAIWKKVGFED